MSRSRSARGPLTMEHDLRRRAGAARAARSTRTRRTGPTSKRAAPAWSGARAGAAVYGVTHRRRRLVPGARAAGADSTQLPRNLFRIHGGGTGRRPERARRRAAVVAARLASLCPRLLRRAPARARALCELLDQRLLPCIPAEGSVGASGDLTPLSYIAACVSGEREVSFEGRRHARRRGAGARAAWSRSSSRPRRASRIMNGTSMMPGSRCLAFERARRLARFASALTAMASEVMRGDAVPLRRAHLRAQAAPRAARLRRAGSARTSSTATTPKRDPGARSRTATRSAARPT